MISCHGQFFAILSITVSLARTWALAVVVVRAFSPRAFSAVVLSVLISVQTRVVSIAIRSPHIATHRATIRRAGPPGAGLSGRGPTIDIGPAVGVGPTVIARPPIEIRSPIRRLALALMELPHGSLEGGHAACDLSADVVTRRTARLMTLAAAISWRAIEIATGSTAAPVHAAVATIRSAWSAIEIPWAMMPATATAGHRHS